MPAAAGGLGLAVEQATARPAHQAGGDGRADAAARARHHTPARPGPASRGRQRLLESLLSPCLTRRIVRRSVSGGFDDSGQQLDNSCKSEALSRMSKLIPNYALYGDQDQPGWEAGFDFEWIPQRSVPYNFDIKPHTTGLSCRSCCCKAAAARSSSTTAAPSAGPCVLLVPAQTVHGFHFSPDVDGPVVTAAQRPLESLAAVVMPELLQTLRRPAVLSLQGQERALDQLMPLFLAVEREARACAIGQVAAGLSLLIAVLVQIARVQQLQQGGAPAPQRARRSRSSASAAWSTRISASAGRCRPMPITWASRPASSRACAARCWDTPASR
jgi:hypothetical protein